MNLLFAVHHFPPNYTGGAEWRTYRTAAALQARGHAEVANGLVVGPLDAVVVWNFVVGLYPGKLEVVPTGATYPATRVTLLGLTSSEHSVLRDAFLEWCQRPVVRETFARYGYKREKE